MQLIIAVLTDVKDVYRSEHLLTSEDKIKFRMIIIQRTYFTQKGLTFHFKAPLLRASLAQVKTLVQD